MYMVVPAFAQAISETVFQDQFQEHEGIGSILGQPMLFV